MLTIDVDVTDKTKKFHAKGTYTKFETPAELMEVLDGTVPELDDDEKPTGKQVPSEDALKALANANYGANLRCRANLRAQAESLAEGPEKADAKAVSHLVAVGFGEEEAKAIVAAKRAQKAAEAQADTEAEAEAAS